MRISDWSSDVCSSDLVGEVVVDQRVVSQVDLGGQLAVAVGADEEVDVRRALAVAAERGEQLLGRAAGRHAVAAGHDAAKAVAALFVGDDSAAHVERRLLAGRVEVRERKSVVEGKRVSVRVDIGGCGIIKKKII